MLGFIRGSVKEIFPAGKNTVSLVLWTENDSTALGVAYTILVSELQAAHMIIGTIAEVWTYPVQAERESYLIGFGSSQKLRMFLKLLAVSGVGPKTAMQIVDSVPLDDLIVALTNNDVSIFNKIPGIGKKTAAKIIVELSGQEVNVGKVLHGSSTNEQFPEVLATLKKLGYTTIAAKDAIARALSKLQENPNLSVAEQVKLVLSHQ
jgi:Holliday junction DNA helicase RuvA